MPKAKERRSVPVVFISSTYEDLKPYRLKAEAAAKTAGFLPVMQEYFVSGPHEPLSTCLKRLEEADVVVVIVAHRYGWVPEDQPEGEARSITWLECARAVSEGKDLLVFIVDPKCQWPPELYEGYQITEAVYQRKADADLLARFQRNVNNLDAFKQWLESGRTRRPFDNPDGLRAEVGAALTAWLNDHPEFSSHSRPQDTSDPRAYLEMLREQTAWVNIRGLQVGTEKAHRFPVEELYMPLTVVRTVEISQESLKGRPRPAFQRQPVELEEAMAHRRLVIVGDPGSGKSTFLQRVVFALADFQLKEKPAEGSKPALAAQDVGPTSFVPRLVAAMRKDLSSAPKPTPAGGEANTGPPLPVLIRIADLAEHIRKRMAAPGHQRPAIDAPEWLMDFLRARSEGFNWGLSETFLRRRLNDGRVVLLLDGLDEASDRIERAAMARLFENLTHAYRNCRFVVTTRPLSYAGEATLAGFEQARIAPLETEAAEQFLRQWCWQLYPQSAEEAARHLAELLEALRGQLEIRRMAHNPVMLTALAVVHWNERRLPEQRADLYWSVLRWLARTREKRPGREPADRCLALLQVLALAMQNSRTTNGAKDIRQVQIGKGQAAEILADQFSEVPPAQRLQKALAFLGQEEEDSGIIVSRGGELRFWHLTFQEYLAAREIAGLPDEHQHKLLLVEAKIHRPEWREVALLLTGVLMEQGRAKVDALISAMLDRLGEKPSLADQARCAGLTGAMVQDLKPLGYQPGEPRYRAFLDSVLAIFDPAKAGTIDLPVRLEAAEALGQAGDPRLRENNWVTIPAARFLMGAQTKAPREPNYDTQAYDDEAPVHEVSLCAFQIGRYPVTVDEYRRFMEADGYRNEAWWKAGGYGVHSAPAEWEEQTRHPNRPVANVSWHEAAAWCAWAGGRLPTEAEWERAARGTQGRMYPWGNEPPDVDRANYGGTKVGHPTPVGLFPTGMTPEGLHDMAGNVWEWCADWYAGDYYKKPSQDNPQGPANGKERVVRGGSWILFFLRSPLRYLSNPARRDVGIGFRCVREVHS